LIFSMAFNAIAGKGTAAAILFHIISRQPLPPKKSERERLKRAGQWPKPPETFSFPQREARCHGLTEKGVAKGLRSLHSVGIIDISHHGSAIRGDFNLYIMSDRWRRFGTVEFENVEWPKSKCITSRDIKQGVFVSSKCRKSSRRRPPSPLSHGNTINTAENAAIGRK
jgi:hypothetical protein